MSTAIALMNRLRSKTRSEQVTAFASTDDEHLALLSELNQAIRIVLEERTWNFQHRSDGSLILRKSYTESDQTTQVFSNAVTLTTSITTPASSDLNGEFTTSIRLHSTIGFDQYNDVSFDLLGCRFTTSILGTTTSFPISFFNGVGWTVYVYQYALPTTVRAVTEIWHQKDDIEIFQEDEGDFRRMIPRPHEDLGSMPKVAFVGGTLTTTVSNASSSTGSIRDAIRIWPVPGSNEILHYRYIHRQPDMVNETDEIKGVPLSVEDLIIQLAYARQLQSIQADPSRGLQMEARVMQEVDMKHRNNRFDPQRHRTLKSLDHIGDRPSALLRKHTTVPGWP